MHVFHCLHGHDSVATCDILDVVRIVCVGLCLMGLVHPGMKGAGLAILLV